MKAIVYVGHGIRSAKGNDQFLSFMKETIQEVDIPIQEVGFLESFPPTSEQAIANAVRKGATEICLMPVLLLMGVHAKFDLPALIDLASKKYPHVRFSYGKPLGPDPIAAKILANRLVEKGFNRMEHSAVLLTGHGSRVKETAIQFGELTDLLKIEMGFDTVFPCYLKSNSPLFIDALQRLLLLRYDKIYVLPYLLFSGGYTEIMKRMADNIVKNASNSEIIHCESLRFHYLLRSLLVKRVQESLRQG
jgi:sirohydrochlorin ferrochelatase